MKKATTLHSYEAMRSQFYINSNGRIVKKLRYTMFWHCITASNLIVMLALFPQLAGNATVTTFANIITKIEKPADPAALAYLKINAPKLEPAYLSLIFDSSLTAAAESKIDKNLLLAVMRVESGFDQYAMSDRGAICLMQIMPNWHAELLKSKFKQLDSRNIYDIDVCIHSGAKILAGYIREQGSIERGLLQYNGSLADPSKSYAVKVLAEKQRIDKFMNRK